MEDGKCKHCGAALVSGYVICWQCGTHRDGTPPSEEFVPDHAPNPDPDLAKSRELSCLRCGESMTPVSRMRFHEGTRMWPVILGDLGELFVHRETFDTYACATCGKVEFFVTG